MAKSEVSPRSRIGERLKQARETLGMSQADVCRQAGVSANAYNQWEKGRRLVNIFDAMRLADCLKITLDWIYRGEGKDRAMREDDDAIDGDGWSEADSAYFMDVGRYFVPDREVQIETICDLIPDPVGPAHIVELCCGEGLLSRAILERLPGAIVHAFDGSAAMLEKARTALATFGNRFDPHPFDIIATDWRKFPWRLHAVVSSLAIHHLDGPQKQQLYKDVARALAPGGVFVIADLVEPTTPEGWGVAAKAWDDAVRSQALALDGDLRAFERFLADNWNYYSDPEPDPVDKPSPLYAQLAWLEAAGLKDADVHWLKAGHAVFSARKRQT